MTLDDETRAFLRNQLPQVSDAHLAEAFGFVYGEIEFGPSMPKRVWQEESARIRAIAAKLSASEGDEAVETHGLPDAAVAHLKEAEPKDRADAAKILLEYAELSEIWHRDNPKTGGRDIKAYQIASAIRMAFDDLKEIYGDEITISVSMLADGVSPAAPFGCIVEHALDYHGGEYKSRSSWRRAAMAAASEDSG